MKGRIVIDRELCKGCGYCIIACPKGLITSNEDFNSLGYHPVACINMDECTGCGLCAIICPDIAIEVWRETEG